MPDRAPRVIDGPFADTQVETLAGIIDSFPGYAPSSNPGPIRRPSEPTGGAPAVTGDRLAPQPTGPPGPGRPGPAVGWRYDVVRRYMSAGGKAGGAAEPAALRAARNNYLRGAFFNRDSFAYRPFQPGGAAHGFLHHEALVEAARALFGLDHVIPERVFANVMLPGQELAVHTDVPEFAGARRDQLPGWLLVVMLHSGLYEHVRVPVATAVNYVYDSSDGRFAYFWDGVEQRVASQANRAIVFDADSVFHSVDPIGGDDQPLRCLTGDSRLRHSAPDRWTLHHRDGSTADFLAADLRFSLSWKAVCFADRAEHRRFQEAEGDLGYDAIVGRLLDNLVEQERIERPAAPMSNRQVADALVESYIRFPSAA
ncbi:MAG TPA: hypothetical protein VG435_10070 [Acidimicrobiales bacterium]|jgi:hypothetical protein|nr:hypothetical protein [Acidimicrobiales bacterium]